MIIGAVSTASLASAVWSAATRSLTNTGAALGSASIPLTTIAGSSSVDLRASVGRMIEQTIAVKTGATATSTISIHEYDGTSVIQLAVTLAGANAPVGFTAFGVAGVGQRITNNDTVAGTYMFSGGQWVF